MSDKFKYTAGLNNVGSYQVSGKPFVTASTISDGVEQQIEFPQVTNNITVKIDSDASIANNSLFISASVGGALNYLTENDVSNGSDGDDRSLTMWLSSSTLPAGGGEGGVIFGSNVNYFSIREKGSVIEGIVLLSTGEVKRQKMGPASPAAAGNGWVFLAFTVESGVNTVSYVNSVAKDTDAISTTTLASSFGNRLQVGPAAFADGNIAVRDCIMWDKSLTAAEVLALHEASASYDDPAFQVANKLFWLKPGEGLGSYQKLKQHGSLATGDLVLNGLGAPEIAKVISDSPFPDVKTTSQTVRYLDFLSDGITDGASVQDALQNKFAPTNGSTVALWLKVPRKAYRNDNTYRYIVNFFPGGQRGFIVRWRHNLKFLDLISYHYPANDDSATDEQFVQQGATIAADYEDVIHLVIAQSGGIGSSHNSRTSTVYLDGQEIMTSFIGNTRYRGRFNAVSLNNHGGQSPYFSFMDLAIYNKCFDQSEVSDLYNNGYFKSPNKVEHNYLNNHYIFDDTANPADAAGDNDDVIIDRIAGGGLGITPNDYDTGELAFANHTFTTSYSSPLRIHYRSTGSSNVVTNNHYWTLGAKNESITMNVKSKEIYLSAPHGDLDYSLHADLTTIPTSSMYQHTGTGVDE